MGVEDPVDKLKAQEICMVVKLVTKSPNEVATAAITNDKELGQKIQRTMLKWNATFAALIATPDKKRNGWMMQKARKYRAGQMEQNTECKAVRMNVGKSAIWDGWQAPDDEIESLVALRRELTLREQRTGQACLKCLKRHGDEDHVRHILHVCRGKEMVEARAREEEHMSTHERMTWNTVGTEELANMSNNPGKHSKMVEAAIRLMRQGEA